MLCLLDQCAKQRGSRGVRSIDFEDLFKKRLETIKETIEEEEEEDESVDENGKKVSVKIKEGRISKPPSSFGEAYVMFVTQLASKGGFQVIPQCCNFCHEHHDEKDHKICLTKQRDNLREKSATSCLLDHCAKERGLRSDTSMDEEDLLKRKLENIEEKENEDNVDENGKKISVKIKDERISKPQSRFGEAYVMFISALASKGGFQLIPQRCNFCHERHDEKGHKICLTKQRDNLREKSTLCLLDHCAKERGSRSDHTSMEEEHLLKRKPENIEEEEKEEEDNVDENGKKISAKIKEGRISKHQSRFGEAYVMFITGLASKGGFPLIHH